MFDFEKVHYDTTFILLTSIVHFVLYRESTDNNNGR